MAGFIILILLVIFITAYNDARKDHIALQDAKRREQTAIYHSISAEEGEWIRQNQLENGAILLYRQSDAPEGTVNPYFACLAALGLLSDHNEENIKAVEKYLNWHTGELLKYNGIIKDYSLKDGVLTPTEKADSVDSYAAEYLLLLAEYAETAGEAKIESINGWYEAVGLLHEALLSVTDEITYANQDHDIAYLMDNCEVYEACLAIGKALPDDNAEGQWYISFADDLKEKAMERFWRAGEGSFSYGIFADASDTGAADFDIFYPDAIAQLYPVFTGMTDKTADMERLYNTVCSRFDWQQGKTDTTFEWSVMSDIALSFDDEEAAEEYLGHYRSLTEVSRGYPMHTANAGWVMRTCNRLSDKIENAPYEALSLLDFVRRKQ